MILREYLIIFLLHQVVILSKILHKRMVISFINQTQEKVIETRVHQMVI